VDGASFQISDCLLRQKLDIPGRTQSCVCVCRLVLASCSQLYNTPPPPSLYTPLGCQHFNITPLPLTPHKYITFRGTFNYHIGITIFFCLSSCLLPLFLSALLLSSFFLSSSSVVVAYLSPLSLTSSSPVAVDHLARSRT